ncbi:MAG: hypothetical protein KBD94_00375 [Pyrinomonadaceae bacterium]|nr:hypothetical protein [Pyrinomonadaceae bacterium]
MISDEEIDRLLLLNMTKTWRKVALIVGTTMTQIDRQERAGKNDSYFANRVEVLVKKGLVEHDGDLNQMRRCEVRLSDGYHR